MENLQDQIQQAKALERAHKNDAALDVFLRLSQEDGPHLEDPSFWVRLGDLGRRTQRLDVAADAYPRAADLLEQHDHPILALAVVHRLARVAADSPAPHLRFGSLAAGLGYGRDAREAFGLALELADNADTIDAAVEGLRTTWAILRRAGLQQDADAVRTRIVEVRPESDPVGDPLLDPPDLVEQAADDLAILESSGELAEAPPTRGLQPTAVAEDTAEPEVERIEGLEPTSAGGDWETPTVEEEANDSSAETDELPGLPDLPLLRPELDAESAEDAAEPESLDGLISTSAGYDEADRDDDDDDEGRVVGELPLLSNEPEPAADRQEQPPETLPGPQETLPGPQEERARPRDPDPEPVAEPEPEPDPEPVASSGTAQQRRSGDDYIDLGALIRDEEEEVGTRFQMDAAQHPSGDEDRDFAEILGTFRQHVSEKIDAQDATSHYDLGLAFKDMGLIDDAIGQLQVALRAGSNPVATLEVLGECFIEKGEHSLAARVLDRATRIKDASESELIGVLYWLGRTQETLDRPDAARGYYERVVAVDISFRDVRARLSALRDAPPAEGDE